ncbi:MAG TPA: hypothetical protein VFZ24_12010 [Longimicrobiales bacterium]
MARADLADWRLMRLGLSSAAAADVELADLVQACTQRGLSALELREEDAHGVAFADVPAAQTSLPAGLIAGLYARESTDAVRLARAAVALRAPVIVADEGTAARRVRLARSIAASGGGALPLMRGPARDWLDGVADQDPGYAWEVDPGITDLARDADLVLRAVRAPDYIRFIGGGPEAALQEGRGIGVLMGRLALAGYDGAVVLAPSSPRYRVAWSSWLGRRGGWGCGSKVADAALVRLY